MRDSGAERQWRRETAMQRDSDAEIVVMELYLSQ